MMHVNIVLYIALFLYGIVSLTSLDSFKYHLDKLWSSQDIKHDWRADMAGTAAVNLNL
jgi:hypothetical protein